MSEHSQQKAVTILRILYPVWMIFGIFSLMYIPSKMINPGDVILTAKNITTNIFLFRAGIAGSLITQLLFIFAALYLYRLFAPVNKNVSGLMVVLALVSVPIAMLNVINKVAALMLLQDPGQMMFFLRLNEQGIVIASIFWGLWLFPLGYLVYRSGYFPKSIGIAVLIGGLGYTISAFTKLLIPDLNLILWICEIMTFGEVIWLLWLVIRGAKLPE